jgi:predicted transcriptional regulator
LGTARAQKVCAGVADDEGNCEEWGVSKAERSGQQRIIKTNKHHTLRLVQQRGTVRAHDLVQQCAYSPATARSYLSYLSRQDLLERTSMGYTLTSRGDERLRYFDVAGCPHPDCPLCERKSGSYICPRCGYAVAKQDARILLERDFLVVVRLAGVYCPLCLKLLFPESQALVLGIPKER